MKASNGSDFGNDFEGWLDHYRRTTGRNARGSKAARRAYAARRREGISDSDLRLATEGAHGDDFLRRNGYDVPETILRESKVARYIELGKRSAPADALEQPTFDPDQREAGIRAWQIASAALAARLPDSALANYVDPVEAKGLAAEALWIAAPAFAVHRIQRAYGELIRDAAGVETLYVVAG